MSGDACENRRMTGQDENNHGEEGGSPADNRLATGLSIGLALGTSIGVVLGLIVFDNLALGLGLGLCLGVAVGSAIGAGGTRDDGEQPGPGTE